MGLSPIATFYRSRMKFVASNINHTQDVEIDNAPVLTFDELAVPTADGNVAFVQGSHFWNRLLTNTDMTPLIGQWFNLQSEQWNITDCILCIDGSIFFRNAEQISGKGQPRK